MSSPLPLRYTKQLEPDRWMTQCNVCPKRYRKFIGPTQQAVDHWWQRHEASRVHVLTLNPEPVSSARRAEEQRILDEIFGPLTNQPKITEPEDRAGELFIQPGHVRKLKP